ncbi:MAG TPA: Stp1/IreP family PP2C-type Ser/Thr phosphatase [Stellaceae bacterium]|nr:Stp1/IreP family PP2C-type Ser/Thr phosphatase [Stellaceae bacterium]
MFFFKRLKPRVEQASASLSITGTMLTDTGRVREHNEDTVAYSLPSGGHLAKRELVALVADGMGGHLAGEVASSIAADVVLRLYFEREGSPTERLANCLNIANQAIYERGQTDPACAGMGTTCTVLAVRGNAAFLGHVGDSRAYLLRSGRLQQISEDHSLVAQMVRDGVLTEEEAARSPDKNVILRALGNEARVKPTVWREGLPLMAGDALVLCSDGLSDVVDKGRIEEIVREMRPFEACQALIDAALAAGGPDNISVGVFAVAADQEPGSEVRNTRPLSSAPNGELS